MLSSKGPSMDEDETNSEQEEGSYLDKLFEDLATCSD